MGRIRCATCIRRAERLLKKLPRNLYGVHVAWYNREASTDRSDRSRDSGVVDVMIVLETRDGFLANTRLLINLVAARLHKS